MEKTQEVLSAVVSNAQVGETIYEPATHILWTRLSASVHTVGPVKGVLAAVLTEEGMIAIGSYATAADFEKYAPVFEAIARKTIVADNLKYRPRLTDSLPLSAQINWSSVLWGALIGAIGGGLSAAIAVIFKVGREKKTHAGQRNGSGFTS